MWTTKNRPRYNRDRLRYPSDLTDAEWEHIKPLIPPAKRGGGKRRVDMREVVNGVMYVLSTGCQWRYIPKDRWCNFLSVNCLPAAGLRTAAQPGSRQGLSRGDFFGPCPPPRRS